MNRSEVTEAVKSQRNRYAAMLAVIEASDDAPNDPRIWTLIEDGAQFGLDLMIEVCTAKGACSAT